MSDESEKPESPEANDAVGDRPESKEPHDEAGGASPDAIARRVAALGADDDDEAKATAEEQRLAARRAEAKAGAKKASGGGGRGLEAAASKRLANIGSRKETARRAAGVATARDPRRPVRAGNPLAEWAKENPTLLGGGLVVLALGIAGTLGYLSWQQSRETAASTLLTSALDDARGRIGDPAKEEDADRPKDPRPVFKTDEERRAKALADFREVESKYRGTGAAYLARLEEGSLLLDQKDAAGARAAFQDVTASPLGRADAQVRGRALEGTGFADELDAKLDDAIKAFKELEGVDAAGFKELGQYHQARVYEAKGTAEDKGKAKELLKSVYEKVSKPEEARAFPYLAEVAQDRLRLLDPSAIKPKTPVGMPGMPGGAGGSAGGKMSEEQIQKLLEQMKQRASQPTPAVPGEPLKPAEPK